MEFKIRQMIKRLLMLGYCQFEIKNIISEAIGNDHMESLSFAHANQVMEQLALYEKLGLDYMNNYSK
jgi:hypothetical protein